MVYLPSYAPVELPTCGAWEYLHPDKPSFDPRLPAFIDGITGRELNRAEVKDIGLRLATGLRELGLKRHDVACIWGLNSLEWIMAGFGCMAAGITVSPANFAFSPKELAYQINNSDAQIIFLDPAAVDNFDLARDMITRPFPDSRVVLLCEPQDKPFPSRFKCVSELFGKPGKAEVFRGNQVYETMWLCYSSGTTGLPKGVESTHHNFTSQLQALKPSYQRLGPGDKMIAFPPLSHTYGTTMVLQQPFSVGACAVILPRFEEIAFLSAIEKVGNVLKFADRSTKSSTASSSLLSSLSSSTRRMYQSTT